jgi:hypothetical protein
VLGGLAESLQLLLAVVAIVQGIWGELREHVQRKENVIGRARARRRSVSARLRSAIWAMDNGSRPPQRKARFIHDHDLLDAVPGCARVRP